MTGREDILLGCCGNETSVSLDCYGCWFLGCDGWTLSYQVTEAVIDTVPTVACTTDNATLECVDLM